MHIHNADRQFTFTTLSVWAVIVYCLSGLWLCLVYMGCDCVLSIWVVIVHWLSGMWMYIVYLGCDCALSRTSPPRETMHNHNPDKQCKFTTQIDNAHLIVHCLSGWWLYIIYLGCDCALSIWVVILQCLSGVWMCIVYLDCDCALSIWVVNVHCLSQTDKVHPHPERQCTITTQINNVQSHPR
jgi:hypothetical protein